MRGYKEFVEERIKSCPLGIEIGLFLSYVNRSSLNDYMSLNYLARFKYLI